MYVYKKCISILWASKERTHLVRVGPPVLVHIFVKIGSFSRGSQYTIDQLSYGIYIFIFLNVQSNISLILHAVQEYDLSLRFLEKALALNIKFYGSKSLKVAVSYHLVARTQSCMGDFRSALSNERETYAIYKQQVLIQMCLLKYIAYF